MTNRELHSTAEDRRENQSHITSNQKRTSTKEPDLLSLMHFNIQGIASKASQLEVLLDIHPTDIVCFSEHWLTSAEMKHFKLNGYTLINSFCRKEYTHGGVCIFATKNLYLKPFSYNKCIEKIFEVTIATFKTLNKSLFLITVYRIPNSSIDLFVDEMYALIYEIYKTNSYYIVCGDFNVDFLVESKDSKKVADMFREFDMKNHIDKPTRITKGIDAIFSNMSVNSAYVKDTHLSDHTFQICSFSLAKPNNEITKIFYRHDYSDDNLITFRNLLLCEKWADTYTCCDDVNAAFDAFYTTFKFHYLNSFPLKRITVYKKKKPWINNEIKQLHQTLCELSKLARSTNNEIIKNRHNELKILYTKIIHKSKSQYNNSRIENANNISKESWKIINETKDNHSSSSPSEISINNKIISDKTVLCNHFNDIFLDVEKITPNMNKLNLAPFSHSTFFLHPTTPYEIQEII